MLKGFFIILVLLISTSKTFAFSLPKLITPFSQLDNASIPKPPKEIDRNFKEFVDKSIEIHSMFVNASCFSIPYTLWFQGNTFSRELKSSKWKCSEFLQKNFPKALFDYKTETGKIPGVGNCTVIYSPFVKKDSYDFFKALTLECDYSDFRLILRVGLQQGYLNFLGLGRTFEASDDYTQGLLKRNIPLYLEAVRNRTYESGIIFGTVCAKEQNCIETGEDFYFYFVLTKDGARVLKPGKSFVERFPSKKELLTERAFTSYYNYKKVDLLAFFSALLNGIISDEFLAWASKEREKELIELAIKEKEKEFEKKLEEEFKEEITKNSFDNFILKVKSKNPQFDYRYLALIHDILFRHFVLAQQNCVGNIRPYLDIVYKAGSCQGFFTAYNVKGTFSFLTGSGSIIIGNVAIVYDANIPKKIEYLGGMQLAAIPLFPMKRLIESIPIRPLTKGILQSPEKRDFGKAYIKYYFDALNFLKTEQNTSFLVNLSLGKGEAQFILGPSGIEQIQNFSSLFEIKQMMSGVGVNITLNELVLWLKKYYDYSKEKNQIDSFDFISSLLTNILEQERFIMWVAEQKKQSHHQQDLIQDQDKAKTNSQIKKDEKEQKQQTTKKRGVRR